MTLNDVKEKIFCVQQEFQTKGMGETDCVLGIRTTRDHKVKEVCFNKENYINEKVEKYIDQICLKRFHKEICKAFFTQLLK